MITLEHMMGIFDIFIPVFDNYDITKNEHVKKMNNNATTGNIDIYNDEVRRIGFDGSSGIVVSPHATPCVPWTPQVTTSDAPSRQTHFKINEEFPGNHGCICSGRDLRFFLGCREL